MPSLVLSLSGVEIGRHSVGHDSCVVGRSVQADLQVRDISLSRRHLRIYRADADPDHGAAHWLIEDLGSKNGTTLNGRAVTAPTPLSDGDLLHAGRLTLLFRITTDPHTDPHADPHDHPHPTESETTYLPNPTTKPATSRPAAPSQPETDAQASGLTIPPKLPSPKPKPLSQDAISASEETELSSRWDSLMASQPDLARAARARAGMAAPIVRLPDPTPDPTADAGQPSPLDAKDTIDSTPTELKQANLPPDRPTPPEPPPTLWQKLRNLFTR